MGALPAATRGRRCRVPDRQPARGRRVSGGRGEVPARVAGDVWGGSGDLVQSRALRGSRHHELSREARMRINITGGEVPGGQLAITCADESAKRWTPDYIIYEIGQLARVLEN